jgi:hypothetical protein
MRMRCATIRRFVFFVASCESRDVSAIVLNYTTESILHDDRSVSSVISVVKYFDGTATCAEVMPQIRQSEECPR